jgi:PelA/Pel-15E family pectate lyase
MTCNHPSLSTGSILILVLLFSSTISAEPDDPALRDQALRAMRRAATFYREHVAKHGGYVYYYSTDLKKRFGEGVATPDQIWVQQPGTPTVGLAYVAAFRATRDDFYRDAIQETARALIYGQLESGGWTNSICFDPKSPLVAQYRNGKGRGRNYSTLDDGITQNSIRFLIQADQALASKDAEIHQAAMTALNALLQAQFPNGGFPQVWTGPVSPQPIVAAKYPDYDWRTDNRIKNYWELYTLNDDLTGYVANALLDAVTVYDDPRCKTALVKLGDFLIAAQMPDPQPAWAQQYDYEMRPVWARKFEPPAVCGRESQDAIETLMKVYRLTGDAKYLAPIPRAVAYLKSSLLPDGRLARYYELKSNKPLYMTDDYKLTHDDRDVPDHYGWKTTSRIEQIEQQFAVLQKPNPDKAAPDVAKLRTRVSEVVRQLDKDGRWVSEYSGQPLNGQPKFRSGDRFISSAAFSENLETLSTYLETTAR